MAQAIEFVEQDETALLSCDLIKPTDGLDQMFPRVVFVREEADCGPVLGGGLAREDSANLLNCLSAFLAPD